MTRARLLHLGHRVDPPLEMLLVHKVFPAVVRAFGEFSCPTQSVKMVSDHAGRGVELCESSCIVRKSMRIFYHAKDALGS